MRINHHGVALAIFLPAVTSFLPLPSPVKQSLALNNFFFRKGYDGNADGYDGRRGFPRNIGGSENGEDENTWTVNGRPVFIPKSVDPDENEDGENEGVAGNSNRFPPNEGMRGQGMNGDNFNSGMNLGPGRTIGPIDQGRNVRGNNGLGRQRRHHSRDNTGSSRNDGLDHLPDFMRGDKERQDPIDQGRGVRGKNGQGRQRRDHGRDNAGSSRNDGLDHIPDFMRGNRDRKDFMKEDRDRQNFGRGDSQFPFNQGRKKDTDYPFNQGMNVGDNDGRGRRSQDFGRNSTRLRSNQGMDSRGNNDNKRDENDFGRGSGSVNDDMDVEGNIDTGNSRSEQDWRRKAGFPQNSGMNFGRNFGQGPDKHSSPKSEFPINDGMDVEGNFGQGMDDGDLRRDATGFPPNNGMDFEGSFGRGRNIENFNRDNTGFRPNNGMDFDGTEIPEFPFNQGMDVGGNIGQGKREQDWRRKAGFPPNSDMNLRDNFGQGKDRPDSRRRNTGYPFNGGMSFEGDIGQGSQRPQFGRENARYTPNKGTNHRSYSGEGEEKQFQPELKPRKGDDALLEKTNLGTDEIVSVQGESLRTWAFASPSMERVEVLLESDGCPLAANVEVWDGPDNIPQKMSVYLADGCMHPFRAVIESPTGHSAIAVRNTGGMESPLAALVGADSRTQSVSERLEQLASPRTIEGGVLDTFLFGPSVERIQVLLTTDGHPLNSRIEMVKGPDNVEQVIEIYCENGLERPFFVILEAPGEGHLIRVINTASPQFPMNASVQPCD